MHKPHWKTRIKYTDWCSSGYTRARLSIYVLLLYCFSSLAAQNNEISKSSMAYDMKEYWQLKEYLDNRKYPEAEALVVEILEELKAAGQTKDYIEMLNLHAKSIMHQWRTDEALELYKQMKVMAKEANLNQLHSNAIHSIIVTYELRDSFHLIDELLAEGMSLKGLDRADYSNYHLSLAQQWERKGNLDSAFFHGLKAYEIDIELQDTISLIKTCSVVGILYFNAQNHDKALEYYIEGKSYINGENNYKHSYFDSEIAYTMLQVRNIEKAKYYAEESVRISRLNNLTIGLSNRLAQLADLEEIEGNNATALQYYEEALELNKKPKKINSQINLLCGIISCKLNLNQEVSQEDISDLIALRNQTERVAYKEKIDLAHLKYLTTKGIANEEFYLRSTRLQKSLESRNKLLDLRKLAKLRYDYYNNQEKHDSALSSLHDYMNYRDILFKETQEFKILELEAKYDKVQDEKKIEKLGLKNDLQAQTLRQRTIFLITAASGFVIISLLSFFLYKFSKKVSSQNEVINKSLEDKDFLLREIHHRVKNNLQIISSLLSLQARQIDDESIRQAINEGRNRVKSMAIIHQNLYQNEDLSSVNVSKYLTKLTNELFNTYNIDKERIALNLDIEDISLDVDSMVPFGLILNELISNCLKHAFPNNQEGTITIGLKDDEDLLHLSVKDNGIGIDKAQLSNSNSFGNRLITAFSKKMEADMEVINNNGTTINLRIKNYKNAS